MQSQEQEQMEEDMQALRQLLENLVGLSFDQEGLLDDFEFQNQVAAKYFLLTYYLQQTRELTDTLRELNSELSKP